MPSTSQDIIEKMRKLFEDVEYVSDEDACYFLEKAGYLLVRECFWLAPSPDHKPTDNETTCLVYLIEEWDFGGLVSSSLDT